MLYINDVVNKFNNDIESKLHADDLKLSSEIVIEADGLRLQYGLDSLIAWSNKGQLNIYLKCFSGRLLTAQFYHRQTPGTNNR